MAGYVVLLQWHEHMGRITKNGTADEHGYTRTIRRFRDKDEPSPTLPITNHLSILTSHFSPQHPTRPRPGFR